MIMFFLNPVNGSPSELAMLVFRHLYPMVAVCASRNDSVILQSTLQTRDRMIQLIR